MGLALAMYFHLGFQATLDRFLVLPCFEHGKPAACSVAPGSFNRAISDARACGGNWAGESGHYYAVCPTRDALTSEVR